MRFLVMVKGDAQCEAGVLPSPEMLDRMTRFNEELAKAGVMLAGEGLHPTSKGARLRWDEGGVTATDGPFTESKEIVAGFWIISARSKADAIARMRLAPFEPGAEVEIRPLYEAEEFGDNLTGEVRERSARVADEIAKRA